LYISSLGLAGSSKKTSNAAPAIFI
jgi:hypothetical protein